MAREIAKVFPMDTAAEKRRGYLTRNTQLVADRISWDSHWQELGRYIKPRAARFNTTDRNRAGQFKYGSIINNTATRSVDVLNAGLSNGLTNPAAVWFEIEPKTPALQRSLAARVWCQEVARRMRDIFSGPSNTYGALRSVYDDLGIFGTGAMLVLPDRESLIRCYPLPIGQYALAQDYQGRINTIYRTFSKTVGEVVREFGAENVSDAVLRMWNTRQHDQPVDILHVIEPRDDQERVPGSPFAIHMPWRSCYLEMGGESDRLLREGGFRRFPLIAPRWDVNGEDVYGTSPAMKALGDVKQLQQLMVRLGQAVDYMARPPLQVPSGVKERERDILPGGTSYYEPGTTIPFDQVTPHGGIRNAFEVQLDPNGIREFIQQTELRISRAFHEDAFLMFADLDRRQMTAREAGIREGEKLQLLGPVVDRITNEAAAPLIDLLFANMLDVGAVPPIPEEMQGEELAIKFVGTLAQAQRAVGLTGMQQWMSETLVVAQARPEVLDKINFDRWLERAAEMRGVEPDLLVDDEQVQRIRDARAQAQAAQEQVAMAREQAGAVRDLAGAPISESNALGALVRQGQFQGAA